MEQLIESIDIQPTPAVIGALVVVIGLWLVAKAVKTAVKVFLLVVVAVGVYLFFYGGNVSIA